MRRRPYLLALTALLALGAPAASAAPPPSPADAAGEWTQFGRTAAHLNTNPGEQAFSVDTVTAVHTDYTVALGQVSSATRGGPVVAGGRVFVGGDDSRLHVAPATCAAKPCTELWTGTTSADGYSLLATPAVADGTVLIASPSHELYAFRAAGCGAATCAPIWRGRLQGPVLESSVAVAGGLAYVGDWTGRLYAFRVAGCGRPLCDPVWTGRGPATSADGVEELLGTPAVANGVVYVNTAIFDPDESRGRLYAFAAGGCGRATCAPLWRADNHGPGANDQAPVVAGGIVYSGSSTNFGGDTSLPHLLAFKAGGCGAAVCRPAWSYDVGDGGVSATPALAGDRLFVPTQNTPDPGNTVGAVQSFPARGCGRALCSATWTGVNFYSGEISNPVVVGDVVLAAQSPAGVAPGDDFHLFTGVLAYPVKGCGQIVCVPVSLTSLGNDTGALNGPFAVTGGRIYLQARDQVAGELELFVLSPGCGAPSRTGTPGGSACRPR